MGFTMPQIIQMWEFGSVMLKLLNDKNAEFMENAWDEVVRSTPVASGYARANWFVSPKSPKSTPLSRNKNKKYAYPSKDKNVNLGKRNYTSYFLSNPAPYISVLNSGSSNQAPAMFIQRAVLRAVIEANNRG
jgi:hypothetical protein